MSDRQPTVLSVVGARPNFMKIAPILRALDNGAATDRAVRSLLVHTEQHYDDDMSAAFFADLRIGTPDRTLGVGSASHAVQTAEIMKRFEPVVMEEHPDVVVVVGDVNSTLACALTATKLGVRVAHVEAGLRSFDRSMPEEINRLLTDSVAEFLFTTEESANDNLRREGHPDDHIFFVGNVMIDSLLAARQLAARSTILQRLSLMHDGIRPYGLATLHRPSNVDSAEDLARMLRTLATLAEQLPVILPLHPRTRQRIEAFDLGHLVSAIDPTAAAVTYVRGRVSTLNPVGYVDFLRLMSEARLVLTDSGGIQEETTCLGVPCLTLRENTERPITVSSGTNIVTGTQPARILAAAEQALRSPRQQRSLPPLWDGRAAERIVAVLRQHL